MNEENKEMTKEEVLTRAQNIFRDSKSGYNLIWESMKHDMDQYDGLFGKEENKFSEFLGAKRLFINKTYPQVQRILAEILDVFFNDPDEIVNVKTQKNLPYEYPQAVKTLMNHILNGHPIEAYKEVYEVALDAIKNKYGVFKVYPKIKTSQEIVTQRVLLDDGFEADVELETDVISAYEPRMEACAPEDVMFSRWSTWKDYHQKPVIHRYRKTKAELHGMGYRGFEDVQPLNSTLSDNPVSNQRDEKYMVPSNSQNTAWGLEEVMVYETWDVMLDAETGEYASFKHMEVGDLTGPLSVIEMPVKNDLPYRFSEFEIVRHPFLLTLAYPEPHRLVGKSFPEITRGLQQETNAQANQEREAVARAMRPTVYVNTDSIVDINALSQRRIGGYVKGQGPAGEAIQELRGSDPTGIAGRYRARTDMDYYEIGLPPNLQGISQGNNTATAESQQLSNAIKKLSMVVKSVVYTGLLPALTYLLRLEQNYRSDADIEKLIGRKLGWRLSDDNFPARELIQGDFELTVSLSPGKSNQLNRLLLVSDRMNQYNQSLGVLLQMRAISPEQAQFANPAPVFKELLKMEGMRETGEFMIPAQQPIDTPMKGAPSLPGNVTDPMQQISQMSPAEAGPAAVL